MKLIAFPFAGGNKYSFDFLRPYLKSNKMALRVLEYPGRGQRIMEPAARSLPTSPHTLSNQYNSTIKVLFYKKKSKGCAKSPDFVPIPISNQYKSPISTGFSRGCFLRQHDRFVECWDVKNAIGNYRSPRKRECLACAHKKMPFSRRCVLRQHDKFVDYWNVKNDRG